MINATQFVKDNKLGPFRIAGNELEMGCPFKECPNTGEPQFYINLNTGAWYCHRCGKKGSNLKKLQFSLGLIELQDPIRATHIYIPERDIVRYHEDLFLNPAAIQYLREERGLQDWVIKQFRLGYRLYNDLPVIVIPYFDLTDTCVGAKYDFFTKPQGMPKYIKESGSKSQFFNLNNVTLGLPLIITEGEYDAMSGFQYGFENIGSIPNGANDANGWTEELSGAEKYLLCFDNDRAGQEGAIKLGEVLGKSKCFRVYPRVKDLSDALQLGLAKEEVLKWFKNEEPLFQAPLTDITSYQEKAVEVLKNPTVARGVSTGWNVLDKMLGGVRMKEVSVISGQTGNGKTTFGIALIGNLIRQGVKCLIVSPEMREEKLLIELANNHFKKQVTPEELPMYTEQHKGEVQLANVYGAWTDEKEKSLMKLLFDLIDYSVRRCGVKFIFIDHLRLFTTSDDSERAEIEDFMKKCVRIAMLQDIHIMVVVQPRKLEYGQRKVTKNDLKGSVNIEQDAHNILLIHREEGSDLVEFDLQKNREFGTLGTFRLKFDKKSMANYNEVAEKIK